MKAAWMSCLMALWAPSAFANASEPESARGEQAQIYQRTQLIAGTPIPLEMAQTVTDAGWQLERRRHVQHDRLRRCRDWLNTLSFPEGPLLLAM